MFSFKHGIQTCIAGIWLLYSAVSLITAQSMQPGSILEDSLTNKKNTNPTTDTTLFQKNPFINGYESSLTQSSQLSTDSSFSPDGDTNSHQTEHNPFLSMSPQQSQHKNLVSKEKTLPFDLLLDLTIGYNLSKLYKIVPTDISAIGKRELTYAMGMIFLFSNGVNGKIGIGFLRNRFETQHLLVNANNDTVFTRSAEIFNFATMPLSIGMRFEFKHGIPYVYATLTPSVLTFASLNGLKRTVTNFESNAKLTVEQVYDVNTTRSQPRYNIFIGASVGIERSYGYGAVYVETSLLYMALNPATSHSNPLRISNKFLCIPMSLGLRFYI